MSLKRQRQLAKRARKKSSKKLVFNPAGTKLLRLADERRLGKNHP